MTDPVLIGVLAWPAVWLRRSTLLHWVQDVYPEIAATVTGRRAPLLFRPLRDMAWRRSAGCIVLGEDMAAFVRSRDIAPSHVVVSPNWAPLGLGPATPKRIASQRAAWGLEGQFVAAYAGNLGRVHDLTPLLDVAAALRHEPEFVLLFIGSGAQRVQIETTVRTRSLHNVRFLPAQPREQLALTLSVADVHFVTLLPGAGLYVFPSKLYGIAQVGRPVVFVGDQDTEIARLVRERGLGLSFERSDVSAIAAALQDLRRRPDRTSAMAIAGRQFAADGFAMALATWESVLGSRACEHAPESVATSAPQ